MPHGNAISEHTIRNPFNAAGFKNEIHEHIPAAALNSLSATSIEITTVLINETDEQLKGLDDYLKNITISGQTMNAAEFVDMDDHTAAFNEWFDSCENILSRDANGQVDDDDENGTFVPRNVPPKITKAIEMIEKLRLLVTMQQPQLHKLITELQSKLIDVYIDSKKQKQTTLEDFLQHSQILYPVEHFSIEINLYERRLSEE